MASRYDPEITKAQETLRQQGYDLTKNEVASFFKSYSGKKEEARKRAAEIEDAAKQQKQKQKDRREMYKYLNLVKAAKTRKGKALTKKEQVAIINDSLNQKKSYQQALKEALNAEKEKQ